MSGSRKACKTIGWPIPQQHCIENLRQTIMCKSNISTIPWIYTGRVHENFPSAKTTHVCRDFDKLTK
ncbi:uncharacterized protein B0T23DRAFT_424892 [Neurospora hispaniola]|uniref:Uncharacterized protein n=1 Tax=Neurospora hispaniola TaxID=588809 RepID=A0AAJ0IFJ7_9PEZI|nr:hypothetical protein B0T23DRAFT_424892 [Neurospora hispaniola]